VEGDNQGYMGGGRELGLEREARSQKVRVRGHLFGKNCQGKTSRFWEGD